jgi:hypothetical protein
MTRKRREAITATVVACAIVSGCASVSINDVSLTSVRLVDAADQAELPPPGDMRLIITRLAGDPALLQDLRVQAPTAPLHREHEWLIRVDFTTRSDLSTVNYRDNLGNDIFFCDRPEAHTLLAIPYIYSNGEIVPSGNNTPPEMMGSGAARVFAYHIFFRVSRDESVPPSKPPLESFDLRQKPEDVCFRIVGGEYRAFGYRSNTVVVPKNLIVGAVEGVPPVLAR